MLTSSYILMTYKQDEIVITKPQDVIIEIKPEISEIPDILKKIAFCESGNKQFNSDGSVLRGKQNSKDVGKYQINEFYHLANAQKMGIDIYTEEGNTEYALYLYNKNGTKDWRYSSIDSDTVVFSRKSDIKATLSCVGSFGGMLLSIFCLTSSSLL